MTTLQDIGADGGAGDLPPFIDETGKEELIENQHPFFIVGGTVERTGQFKPQTFYVIRFGSPGKTTALQDGTRITLTAPGWAKNAELWTLAFGANDDRKDQMAKILKAVAVEENSFVGPCFLHGIPLKSGHTYKKIRGVRDENPQPVAPASGNGDATPQSESDETIPFANDDTFRVTI
jgi:hypothetical protein